jgi:NADH-quinone oxidoreductase subunit C
MAEPRAERETPTAPLPAGTQERIDRLSALLSAAAPEIRLQVGGNAGGEVVATIDRAEVLAFCRILASSGELAFNHLRFIAGVDQLESGIEIIYSLWSYSRRHGLFLKTLLPSEDPHVASVASIWAAADWHERETAEMFGVLFDGHPEPKHLLLDEDLNIHPLLKAHPLAPIELKQGVNTF